MSTTQEIMLVCGHLSRASHDKGSRLIACSECDKESAVQAKTKTIVTYVVTEVTYQLRLDRQDDGNIA